METALDEMRTAACDLRLSLEGTCELLEDLVDGLVSGEVDELGAIARLQALAAAARSCLDTAAFLDEALADL